MSFWSLIGLPDKKDIQSLQSEMDLLKEENKEYAKMNEQLIRLVGEVHNKCNMISEGLSDDRTKMNALMAENCSETDALRAEITAIRDGILSVQSSSSDTDKQLEQLSTDIKRVNSCLSTISEIDSDLKSLTEYVNCLWSATKALWLNDIVSFFDDSIDYEDDSASEISDDSIDFVTDAAEDIAENADEQPVQKISSFFSDLWKTWYNQKGK